MRAKPVERVLPHDLVPLFEQVRAQPEDRQNEGLSLFLANADFRPLRSMRRLDPPTFPAEVPGRLVTFVDRHGSGLELVFGGNFLNMVRTDLNRLRVRKVRRDGHHLNDFRPEHLWLTRLTSTGIAPRILARSHDAVETAYLGEPVNIFNFPLDWRIQAERLLSGLATVGCAHNDIKASNIIVGKRRLHLIDFEWATAIGTPPPDYIRSFLSGLSDRDALFGAMQAIEAEALAFRQASATP